MAKHDSGIGRQTEYEGTVRDIPLSDLDYLRQTIAMQKDQLKRLEEEYREYRKAYQNISTEAMRSKIISRQADIKDFPENMIEAFVKYSIIILSVIFIYTLGKISAQRTTGK